MWLSRGLQVKLQREKAVYRRWKQGQAIKNEYRNIFWAYRDNTRKAKAYQKLTPGVGIKGLVPKGQTGKLWHHCYMGCVTVGTDMAELISSLPQSSQIRFPRLLCLEERVQ